jgi:nicotinamide-nucleotide amidase
LTSGEGESFIADRLTDFEKELPAKIKLAYLPKLNIVKLRLTAIDVAESEVQKYFDILKKILAHIAVGEGDFELEEIIAQLLIQKNKTVSVAESCTGGQVASRLTSIKGSSAYFKGGIVPYSIKSKISVLGVDASIIENTSVVSKETVLDMAKKCRIKFNTDYAVSASGYLEKNDNGNIVWIGMASENRTIAKKIVVPYDREKNTVFASNTMLNALRIFILED